MTDLEIIIAEIRNLGEILQRMHRLVERSGIDDRMRELLSELRQDMIWLRADVAALGVNLGEPKDPKKPSS